MMWNRLLVVALVFTGLTSTASAQVRDFVPVTDAMLLDPDPGDWLMFSRTFDAQRFSPLDQIDRENVSRLRMAWTRGMGPGQVQSIPLVHDGVMYLIHPGNIIQALDATNGDLIWEYARDIPANVASGARAKNIAIYQDMIFYVSVDHHIVALDARSGELRWETEAVSEGNTSGPIVVDGKVISGRRCGTNRESCYIAAHDAETGEELWKFYTTAGPDEPGGDSWGSVPEERRIASPWGLPGTYDPERGLVYWGIANPRPYTWMARHGDPDEVPRTVPADLYSGSTIALDPDTGELVWYYQHLPADDWNLDYTNERTLVRTRVNPDPDSVKWINPDIPGNEERDVLIALGEGGGLWALDPETGGFIWATPYPFEVPEFHIADIDVNTGKVLPNWEELGFDQPGERHLVCFYNTRGYWPTSYDPGRNALYAPFADECIDMTAAGPTGRERAVPVRRPGSDPNAFGGLAKVDVETGKIDILYKGHAPGNGAILTTAGDLVFWGDMDRRFRAFDADDGTVLWESILGGVIQNSTITYAVDGRQYVAVMTGEGLLTGPVIAQAGVEPARGHNALYVFALPDAP